MSLLFDARPLTVNPELAGLIGINEAIVLQQVHYWLEINSKADKNFKNGKFWTYNTQEKWLEQFPWLTLSTLKRTLKRLESLDLVASRKFNAGKWDHTKWYTINYESVDALKWKTAETPEKSDQVKMNQSNGSNWNDRTGQNEPFSYTETTSEIIERERGSEQGQPPRETSDGFSDALFHKDFLEECFNQGDEQESVATVSNGKTAVVKNKQMAAKVVTLPPSPIPPTPSPQPESVRVRSQRKTPIKFRVNDDGWLRLPTAKKYAFARWLAVRRTNYQMACTFSNIKTAKDEQNRTIVQDNELCFDYAGEICTENELFDEGGRFPFVETRDELFENGSMSQESFNSFLEYVFLDSQRWYEENGATGRKAIKANSAAFEFFNDDQKVWKQVREKYSA